MRGNETVARLLPSYVPGKKHSYLCGTHFVSTRSQPDSMFYTRCSRDSPSILNVCCCIVLMLGKPFTSVHQFCVIAQLSVHCRNIVATSFKCFDAFTQKENKSVAEARSILATKAVANKACILLALTGLTLS